MFSIRSLFVISIIILVSGFYVVYWGIHNKDIALIVSGFGLIGSFVGMYSSAQTSKRQYEQDRPYIVMKPNQDRYNHFQIEFTNVGNSAGIIKRIELNENLVTLRDESIPELIQELVLEGKDSITFPYIISGNPDYKNKFMNFSGLIHYEDINGNVFKNNIILNLKQHLPTLTYNDEALKRDYEIIQISKTLKSIDKSIEELTK
ncbi:hypothetical protein [Rossellomorea marisflavi]|uniref:hypothetical protein n=1 Tax=Rossellomorea marisflavi TaxID=189381 RepID=UPI00064F226D|nr:hypothetical protein [Rossellomorea marisflavi]KML32317.1 hypothetical protein VL12_15625 [Rossellomorea marisflavi]